MKAVAAVLAIAAISAVAAAYAGEPKYPASAATPEKNPKVSFQFSASDATATSPVIISIPGRTLTNADRVHRTSLQKQWLSRHVPTSYEIVSRTLSKCDLKRAGEFPYCDRYIFEDPRSKRRFEYFIYVGNWP